MTDSIALPTATVLIAGVALLLLLGLVQSWRHQGGMTAAARLRALEEELDALRREHEELQSRVRDLEAPR